MMIGLHDADLIYRNENVKLISFYLISFCKANFFLPNYHRGGNDYHLPPRW